jgi:hypothetical protein
METKPFWQSKTILVNIIMGAAMILAQFKPELAAILKEYLGEAGSAWAIINIALRIISKDKVTIA